MKPYDYEGNECDAKNEDNKEAYNDYIIDYVCTMLA